MKGKKCNKMENEIKKLDLRVKKTYTQLLYGLLSLLKEKNFDDITVLEICNSSNVHRATFYKHFNDKFEFLNFCIQYLLEEIEFPDIKNEPTVENISYSCNSFIEVIFKFVYKYRHIITAIFTNKQSITLNTHLTSVIAEFCSEKFSLVLKDAPKHKIQMLSNFYTGSVIGVIKWYVAHSDECPLEDIYTFFSHRIDEICNYYENHLMNETVNDVL